MNGLVENPRSNYAVEENPSLGDGHVCIGHYSISKSSEGSLHSVRQVTGLLQHMLTMILQWVHVKICVF